MSHDKLYKKKRRITSRKSIEVLAVLKKIIKISKIQAWVFLQILLNSD
jgi:hypothetical protein